VDVIEYGYVRGGRNGLVSARGVIHISRRDVAWCVQIKMCKYLSLSLSVST